jgi:hypothetical protein
MKMEGGTYDTCRCHRTAGAASVELKPGGYHLMLMDLKMRFPMAAPSPHAAVRGPLGARSEGLNIPVLAGVLARQRHKH